MGASQVLQLVESTAALQIELLFRRRIVYGPFFTLFIFWSMRSSPFVLPRSELAFYVVSMSAI